jgi:hypothetical protein
MSCVEYVSIVGVMRSVYKLLVTKYEEAIWERRHTREDNIEMDLKK